MVRIVEFPGRSDEGGIFPRRKPIFRPRIGRVRVPANLPKPKYIAVNERYLPNELCPLPRVTLGNNHARRPAMFFWNGFSVPFVRDQNIVIQADLERIVRGIT